MTETLAHGYSSESICRELSNEYQHDRVQMVFKNLCVLGHKDERRLSTGSVKMTIRQVAFTSDLLALLGILKFLNFIDKMMINSKR